MHADPLSFICLNALAFDHRHEPKDAYDLIYLQDLEEPKRIQPGQGRSRTEAIPDVVQRYAQPSNG